MKTILLLGLGKVGTLVGVMLSERYKVTAVSHIPSPYDVDLPFEVLIEDVSNKEKLRTLIKAHDAVFSALPYNFNESIVRISVEENTHYFDLSEDVPTTQLIQKLSKSVRVEQVFVRHAFRFWMGRNETINDGPILQEAYHAYKDSGGSMKALLVSLLTSDAFLYRTK